MTVAPPDTTLFRAVLDTVFAGPAYRWVEEPGLITTLRQWWRRLGDWLHGLETGNPAAFKVLLAALLVVLLLIFAHAAYVTFRTLRGGIQASDATGDVAVGVRHDAAWYAREADRAAAEGRLLDALQFSFTALALTLDGQGLLRYQPSMTPAECAAAAQLADADRRRLRGLVGALYAYVFGGRPCAPDDYARWRAASAGTWHPPPSHADSY